MKKAIRIWGGLLCAVVLFVATVGCTNGMKGKKESYLYQFEGYDYQYAITKDQQEKVFRMTPAKRTVEVLNGVGKYTILGEADKPLYTTDKMKDYTVDESGKNPVVTVHYALSDNAGDVTAIYTLYKEYMDVEISLENYSGKDAASAYYVREFTKKYQKVEKRSVGTWKFPENDDFPYQTFDSLAWIHRFKDGGSMYTFYEGEEAQPKNYLEAYPEHAIPLTMSEDQKPQEKLHFALVFSSEKDIKAADNRALFAKKNLDTALSFNCTTKGTGSATLYTQKDLSFLMEVENLTDQKKDAEVSCQIYGYDGSTCLEKTEKFSVKKQGNAQKKISFKAPSYGSYYAILTMQSGKDTYKEVYPFAVLKKHTYQYTKSSPFGISGVHFGQYQPNEDTISILQELGAANVRVGLGIPEYAEKDTKLLKKNLASLKKSGIRINGQYLLLDHWSEPFDPKVYEQAIRSVLDDVGDLLDGCEAGNEPNLYATYYGYSKEDYMAYYYEVNYTGAYPAIKDAGLKYLGAGVYQGESIWLEGLDYYGIMDKQDVLVTHGYAFPYSPDLTKDPQVELSFESSLVRTRQFLDKTGDKTGYLNECGLPTTPEQTEGISSGVDLRTQADYMARELLLALSYGVDEIEVYSMFDQQNLYHTIMPEEYENNFGLFYQQDYSGRIFPKPSAAAYANITRLLESVEKCEEISAGSDTVRAFRCNLKKENEELLGLWSTKERLSNDSNENIVRTPNLPWVNQWTEKETVTIPVEAKSAKVCDLMGNSYEVPVTDGQIEVEATGAPVFVKLEK